MDIQFTTCIFKEGRTFVAHALELDVSSCGGSESKALRNLNGAVRMGTLGVVLKDAGYSRNKQILLSSRFVNLRNVTLPLPPAHAGTV